MRNKMESKQPKAPNNVATRCEPLTELEKDLQQTITDCEHEVAKVYLHITNGTFSKMNTLSEVIIDEFERRLEEAQADERRTHTEVTHILPQNPADLLLIKELREEIAELRYSLNEIASWDEGEKVGPHFDEPWAARVARAALQSPPQQGK